jgi:ABC-2 type transport system ATP-binding protein
VRPIERTGHSVHLEVADGPRQLMGVLRSLDHEQLEPLSLVVREPSLDDVFLSLTGHRAEGDVDDDTDASGDADDDLSRRGAA